MNPKIYLQIAVCFSTFAILSLFTQPTATAQTNNTFTGVGAGSNLTTGDFNVATGYQAAFKLNKGTGNSIHGYRAGFLMEEGLYNVYNGYQAGYYSLNGDYNILLGYRAGFKMKGDNNIMLGKEAGYNTTVGKENIFIGRNAGHANVGGTSNAYIGIGAGQDCIGTGNLFLGTGAGATANTNHSVFLGILAGHNETNDNRLHISGNPFAAGTATSLIYGEFDDKQVGINTEDIPDGYTLAVKGKTITEEVKVRLFANWPDYVFKAEYELPTLETVENHIETEGHLPGIPSAEEVAEDGFELGAMSAKLLEKVEELTLYMIDLKKENEALKERVKLLEQ